MPSQARREDAEDVLAIIGLRAYERAYRVVMDVDMEEEAMRKSGVPPVLVDEVMQNVTRIAREARHDQRQ